jgi:hypothetical protein
MQADIRRAIEQQRANPDYALGMGRDELEPPASDERPYPGQIRCHRCGHYYAAQLYGCPYRGCHAPNLSQQVSSSGAFLAWAG